jgi:hypothetical protein
MLDEQGNKPKGWYFFHNSYKGSKMFLKNGLRGLCFIYNFYKGFS